MNDDELLRYSRHILLPEIGIDGQEKFQRSHALVMGAGGYRASDYFRAGVPLTILHLGLIALIVPLMFRI